MGESVPGFKACFFVIDPDGGDEGQPVVQEGKTPSSFKKNGKMPLQVIVMFRIMGHVPVETEPVIVLHFAAFQRDSAFCGKIQANPFYFQGCFQPGNQEWGECPVKAAHLFETVGGAGDVFPGVRVKDEFAYTAPTQACVRLYAPADETFRRRRDRGQGQKDDYCGKNPGCLHGDKCTKGRFFCQKKPGITGGAVPVIPGQVAVGGKKNVYLIHATSGAAMPDMGFMEVL